MTKPQYKQTITLETIIEALNNHSLLKAREILYDRIGASLHIEGTIEKVIKRNGDLKFLVKPNKLPAEISFMIFADFTDAAEREKLVLKKIRKGSKISITGDFRSAGKAAATVENCRLKI